MSISRQRLVTFDYERRGKMSAKTSKSSQGAIPGPPERSASGTRRQDLNLVFGMFQIFIQHFMLVLLGQVLLPTLAP
jgi:hypothetical protein